MKKLNMQSLDVIGSNVEKIAHLFPNCVTERLDKAGKPELAIDFEKLQAELSNDIIAEGEERYQFTWPDKRAAVRLANTPTTMTLRPCRKESVDFDNTQNLYIEGDNLDVLKVLRETYLGKVKMIYIDPPYNTGNDFVYNDDFAQGKGEFEQLSGLFDEEGNQTVDPMQRNTESNGRFHTDWLNMMYPRLKVARDLLTDDGVILVSIADRELKNLVAIMDEIFGCNKQVCIFTWKSRVKPTNAGNAKYRPQKVGEYIVVYSKVAPDSLLFNVIPAKERTYPHQDELGSFRTTTILTSNRGVFRRETMRFEANGYTPNEDFRWKAGKSVIDALYASNHMYINEEGTPMEKKYSHEESDPLYPIYSVIDPDLSGTAELGKSELNDLLGKRHGFDTVKPISLLKYLIQTFSNKESVVLDFFSGSATTAHAVMEVNAEDEGQRKFIQVQISEKIHDNNTTEVEYATICEIGKERIRRAGKKVKEEAGLAGQNLDIGFRVLKLDSSNMADVYYTPQEMGQKTLFDENVKPDRSNEDLLFQVMLDLGIELSAKIEAKQIAGKTVHFVDGNYLVACFDCEINKTTIEEIAKLQPVYFVMRDASALTDSVIDNFEQIFKHYSPDTNCRIF